MSERWTTVEVQHLPQAHHGRKGLSNDHCVGRRRPTRIIAIDEGAEGPCSGLVRSEPHGHTSGRIIRRCGNDAAVQLVPSVRADERRTGVRSIEEAHLVPRPRSIGAQRESVECKPDGNSGCSWAYGDGVVLIVPILLAIHTSGCSQDPITIRDIPTVDEVRRLTHALLAEDMEQDHQRCERDTQGRCASTRGFRERRVWSKCRSHSRTGACRWVTSSTSHGRGSPCGPLCYPRHKAIGRHTHRSSTPHRCSGSCPPTPCTDRSC